MDLNNNVALGHSKVMLLMRYIANAIRTFYMLDIKNKYVSWGGGNLVNAHLVIENDKGSIVLKRHVTISGQTEIAVIEGTKVTIGEDCLFSAQINIRTGDSHSILVTHHMNVR